MYSVKSYGRIKMEEMERWKNRLCQHQPISMRVAFQWEGKGSGMGNMGMGMGIGLGDIHVRYFREGRTRK